MGDLLFDRAYHLELIYKDVEDPTTDSIVLGRTQRRVILTNHRMSLKSNYSTKGNPTSSPAQILTLYNVNADIRSQFKVKGAVVRLRAGYLSQLADQEKLEDLPLIIEADVVGCTVRHSDVDTMMTLSLVEFAEERKTATTQVTIPKGVSLLNALQQSANSLTDDVSILLSKNKTDLKFNKRRSYSTTPMEVLRKLSIEFGLHVYFLKGSLYITDKDPLTSRDYQAKGITPLRIPSEEIIGGIDLSADFSKAVGSTSGVEVSFSLLFNPKIKLDRLINIYSETTPDLPAKGTYKVVSMSHSLDTEGTRWSTSIIATTIEAEEEVDNRTSADLIYEEVIYGVT